MSSEEIIALSFGLDQHIPYNLDESSITTAFELFHQNLLKDNSHLPEYILSRIKTKLRYTCEKYYNVKTPYKYQKVIQYMRENQSIIISKPDKGRGVVIMDRNIYTDKCFLILNSRQFTQLNHDPADKFERKLQRVIKKLKPKLSPNIYSNIYPSGLCPAKFYGTAKIYKMSPNDSVQHLPILTIVSNIETATCHLSKYLASLMSPLSESEYE